MTTVQRIIKYLAIALAIFIIINIVSAILFGLNAFADVLGLNRSNNNEILNGEKAITEFNNVEINSLNIDLRFCDLIIKKGDTLKAETTSKYIEYTTNNNELVIKEKSHKWFQRRQETQLIVYIPENTIFDTTKIKTGVGAVKAEKISSKKLSFEIGVGQVEIEELNVINDTKIEGGVGKTDILSGTINDLDLDIGVGKFTINARLIGDNKISAGVGNLDISLIDAKENYTIKANNALGSIQIDGENMTEGTEYGTGNSYITIEGGIGSIDIKSNY